jgi:signal transduction histidine kinase
MKLMFDKRNVKFELHLNGPATIIHGDFHRLKRSLRELIQNALKFTPENGEVYIDYSINQINQNVTIKVRDTGIGIAPDKHNLVFEPFYEVQDAINHMTSKTEFMGGGIGLGLTLAREIFESHKGTLLLESEEKKGSIFTVVLPYSRLVKAHVA